MWYMINGDSRVYANVMAGKLLWINDV